MKKLVVLVLSLAMVFTCVGILSACGGSDGSDEGSGDAGMKVGFICLHDENSTYDLNFINGAKEACEALGISEENYMIKTNIPEGQECYDAAAELRISRMYSSVTPQEPRLTPRDWTTITMHSLPSMKAVIWLA